MLGLDPLDVRPRSSLAQVDPLPASRESLSTLVSISMIRFSSSRCIYVVSVGDESCIQCDDGWYEVKVGCDGVGE